MKIIRASILLFSSTILCMEQDLHVPSQNDLQKARFELGKMLIRGEGIEHNFEKARFYFENVCNDEDQSSEALTRQAWSYLELAKISYFGWGIERDKEKVNHCLENVTKLNNELTARDVPIHELREMSEILRRDPHFNRASINRPGFSRLQMAAYKGYQRELELLLLLGGDINVVDNAGKTTLHWACAGGHIAMVEFLLSKGVDINALANDGRTSLHWAAFEGHKAVVEFLLSKGARIMEADNRGSTALHYAASGGHLSVVEFLLLNLRSVNLLDHDGQSPLWCALHISPSNSPKSEIVDLFLWREHMEGISTI